MENFIFCAVQGEITAKLKKIGMQNFQDTFETCKQSFTSAFSVCMTVPLTATRDLHSFMLSKNKISKESIAWNYCFLEHSRKNQG